MMYLVSFKNEKIETAIEFDNMNDLNTVKDVCEKMISKYDNLNIVLEIYNETEFKTIYKEFGNDIKFMKHLIKTNY